jgi:hypothetical protein
MLAIIALVLVALVARPSTRGGRARIPDRRTRHAPTAREHEGCPLIAVKADRPLNPALPVQHIPACQETGLAHQHLPGAPGTGRYGTRQPLPATATKTSV